ncbi:nucleoside deaminase [Bacillus sp. 31A1R]|uniref:Nucleoside deaminase n=1 Tax=Robertmurraya mangrovi TaxID=3098077 RepID=A0ABU5IZ23_9BACI|nr:nucleoside deaminase [Bacillus sp. 31A1R]MDZ5472366.1 nucleoside deaminase [Bacillus sp. 31A1R]
MFKIKWSEFSNEWRECFKVAWESFQEGSRPVGAIVIDDKGNLVSTGKSATFGQLSDTVISNNELAHAEVNALLKLDNRVHKNVNSYVLYSTLEPCPLCFSAFYMSGIRNLKYAAKDKYGGSTNLKGTTPYLSKKPIVIEGPVTYLEQLSILLNVYFDLSIGYEKANAVHELMSEDYPLIMKIAKEWVELDKLNHSLNLKIEDVYEWLITDLQIVRSI